MSELCHKAVEVLKQLISTPSVSGDESGTADVLVNLLKEGGVTEVHRLHNNVWALANGYDASKPTLLLNSHHDTVKPSPAYTRNPFEPSIDGDVLYGLGSNDAGASLVSLALTFLRFYGKEMPMNILLAMTAEEETMGPNGIRSLLPTLHEQGITIDMAIVGEPTGMNVAVGERGLVVLDCTAHAAGGHAARYEGGNALYVAVDDINILRNFKFERQSKTLGEIKVTVTQINAGRQHNVLPEECKFVVDVRTTDAYTNEETIALLRSAIKSDCQERSTRNRASAIDTSHALVQAATAAGAQKFVSPTTSDMVHMTAFPSIKIGIGESKRSHTPDEFVLISEIEHGLDRYYNIITNLADITNG
jgi:acetylornithine deacetylase